MDGSNDRLDSWKEIAKYLGRDRTTVMRWERTAALPIRRVQGGKGRSVFAYKAEIDRWLAAQPVLPDGTIEPAVIGAESASPKVGRTGALSRTHAALVLALLVGLVSVVAVMLRWDSPTVANASLVGEEIVAVDTGGRELWRHPLLHVDGGIVPARLLIADVDGDDRREVLAALHFMRHGGHGAEAVMLFDDRGRLRWQRSLDDHYQFGTTDYAPVWFPDDIVLYRSGGSPRIAVAYHHHTWWPSVVVTYDADGRPVDRFVNAGWIRSLNVTSDGRYLLAAGISNSFGGAALAVLDPASPGGRSPEAGGTLPACSNCPPGSPVAYFVAPWSELARPSDTPTVIVQVDQEGGIEWHAVQREAVDNGKVPNIIIGFSPNLEIVRRGVNDYFTEVRTALERSGQLSTSAANWREPLVREWTPAHGWQDR
ncbi:MAG: hypothetical protein HY657_09205 [Acidobacteria bacterium]|nr:hypothetical protein [Acidobacteriota bacterium]